MRTYQQLGIQLLEHSVRVWGVRPEDRKVKHGSDQSQPGAPDSLGAPPPPPGKAQELADLSASSGISILFHSP